MALVFHLSLVVLLVTWAGQAAAYEEVHPYSLKLENEIRHAVADFDADKDWITNHVFSGNQGAVTIARDHKAKIEVFRFDKKKMCFARPIQRNINSVWEFKSLLEIAEEHDNGSIVLKSVHKETVDCTNKKIPAAKLGHVAYICKGLPIYEIKTRKSQDDISAGLKRLADLKRLTRSARRERRAWCGVCIRCKKRKRDVEAEGFCARITNFHNCPPRKTD